jgi:hypothetical protein
MLGAAVAVLPLAGAAQNQPVPRGDVKPLNRMAMHVHAVVAPELARLLPAADVLKLVIVAEQAGIAASCAAYDLDAERFGTVMNRLLAPVQALVAEGQQNLPLDVVMGGFATIKGGALARAGYDMATFCAEAEGLMQELLEHSAETPDESILVLARKG